MYNHVFMSNQLRQQPLYSRVMEDFPESLLLSLSFAFFWSVFLWYPTPYSTLKPELHFICTVETETGLWEVYHLRRDLPMSYLGLMNSLESSS